MILNQRIEIGESEKHTVEWKVNPMTNVEEIFVDGQSVYRKFSWWGSDQTFEVGQKEKHKVRVKTGFWESQNLRPIFFVDGVARWPFTRYSFIDNFLYSFLPNDPQKRLEFAVSWGMTVGVFNVVAGLAADILRIQAVQEFGIGIYSAISGTVILWLSYLAKKRSRVALGIVIALLLADGMIGVAMVPVEFQSTAGAGLTVKLIFAYFMASGFSAIKALNSAGGEKISQAPSLQGKHK